jgi:hypothetical protein
MPVLTLASAQLAEVACTVMYLIAQGRAIGYSFAGSMMKVGRKVRKTL